MQLRRELYAAAVADVDLYQEVPPVTLRSLITENLKKNAHSVEARAALGLLDGGSQEESDSASSLHHYQLHWSEQEKLLYYKTLLYVPAEEGTR